MGAGPPGTPEADDPEVREVLDGRDRILLEADLIEDPQPGIVPAAAPAAAALPEGFAVRVRRLPVASRVKLALTGNKESRTILGHDPVKLVQGCVLRNPRITLDEILVIARNRSAPAELLRTIADHSEWTRNYPIRLALVLNPKSPLQVGLGLLGGLVERDLRQIARSRNVPTVIQTQARRRLLARGS